MWGSHRAHGMEGDMGILWGSSEHAWGSSKMRGSHRVHGDPIGHIGIP